MGQPKKQLQIVGTEPPTIPDVEEAAAKYREIRDQRMVLTKEEGDAQAALVVVMQKHKITEYKFDDDEGEEIMVTLDEKVKAKVKKAKSGGDDSEEAA